MTAETDSVHTENEGRTIHFTVDGEPFATKEDDLTPREIMVLAKIDPANHFLTLVKGREQISYEGKNDVEIEMHDHIVFVSAKTGPTPVS